VKRTEASPQGSATVDVEPSIRRLDHRLMRTPRPWFRKTGATGRHPPAGKEAHRAYGRGRGRWIVCWSQGPQGTATERSNPGGVPMLHPPHVGTGSGGRATAGRWGRMGGPSIGHDPAMGGAHKEKDDETQKTHSRIKPSQVRIIGRLKRSTENCGAKKSCNLGS